MFYIALCDDEWQAVEILTGYLSEIKRSGLQLESVPFLNGRELVHQYERGRKFDIIILDMLMKPLNGIETARLIRKYDSEVPILIVTGTVEYAMDGYQVNAYRYILKPVDKAYFLQEVRTILTSIIAVVFFSDSLQNKITIALLFVIMNYACKTAMTGIALAWGEQTLPRELINYRIVMDPWSQMMACILFVLSLWGTICIRELRLNKQNLLYAVISYLFPLTVMISVIIISHKNIGFGSAAGIQVFYIYTSVLLFSASISLFYLLEKNILLDMSGEKSSVMEELLSLQRRHYERLDISQRELQSLRHDIKNHISCLYALLDSGHAKEAKEYIKELYTCNKGLQGIIYSGNIVIDSILSNGLANLENRGINLKCSIIIPPSLNIADVDLCILFGNLIDNAVEACERIVEPGRKKFIVLNVNIKKDYLFIDIANSFTGEVKKQNNIYRTVKIDERYCGIGLFNIRKIVEKYNGEFSVSHSDNVFSVSVMLSLLWGKK